jgi:uncharacterized protein YjbJ (UPF0337 family)
VSIKRLILGAPTIDRCDDQESTMNKDQVKGRLEEAKGKAKEVTGKAIGNKSLEQKGKVQNVGGKVQAGYGDLKEDIKKSI